MSNPSATTERQIDSNLFITVSGPPGCGATTLTEGLAEALNCGYVIGGDIFRDLAEERDLSLQQLIAKAEEDDTIDRALDQRLRRIAEQWGAANKAFILESRLAGWLAGNRADLRIWLDAPEEIRVERLSDYEVSYEIERPAEREDVSLRHLDDEGEIGPLLRVREVSEAGRYESYYGIDVEDQSFYDLSINTARWDAETVLGMVLTAVEGYEPETDEGAFTTRDVSL
ncbi:cytidylate kinase [Haloplanus salinus]|jgi:cytidylate kinase|uniref:Cytidylate kinase n=1 Tax=Haloplanus salinus TaxID=1126245 RepID=A0A368NCQ5_9EURY|nr:AAA family ATPase [Haloplanus salinus]RCU47793.1 cytidylate kinase [Haloplanus salinus]